MPETFLNGRVELHCGDCREVLAQLPDNAIDSCVTDPPYALTSIVQRFGAENAAPAKSFAKSNMEDKTFVNPNALQYVRLTKGFMGQRWDNGEVAFDPAFWAEVLRVLKPGGHVLAMGGTRTYHRLACAIEDAGFEIRDCIMWVYGSGFPKSLDVSKGIDKRKDWSALPRLQQAIKAARTALGISQSEAARRSGLIEPNDSLGGGGFMWFETGMRIPTREQWPQLKLALGIGHEFDACFQQAEREVIGQRSCGDPRAWYAQDEQNDGILDITTPATAAARQWQGWGTALKPSHEPVLLCAKPLQVVEHLNIVLAETTARIIQWSNCNVSDAGKRLSDFLVTLREAASSVLDNAKIRSLVSIGIAPSAALSFTLDEPVLG